MTLFPSDRLHEKLGVRNRKLENTQKVVRTFITTRLSFSMTPWDLLTIINNKQLCLTHYLDILRIIKNFKNHLEEKIRKYVIKLSNYPLPNSPLSMCLTSQTWGTVQDWAQPEGRQGQHQGLAWGFTWCSFCEISFFLWKPWVRIKSSLSAWTYLRFDFVTLSDSSTFPEWNSPKPLINISIAPNVRNHL